MENDFKEIYETDLETKHEQGDIDDEQHESSLSSNFAHFLQHYFRIYL